MYQMEFTESEIEDILSLIDFGCDNARNLTDEMKSIRNRFRAELDNTSLSQHVENWEKDTNCKANGYLLGTSGVMIFYTDDYWSDSDTKRYERMGFTHHRL